MFAAFLMVIFIIFIIGGLVVGFRARSKAHTAAKQPQNDSHSYDSNDYSDGYRYAKIGGFAVSGVCFLLLLVTGWFSMAYSQDVGEAKVLVSFTGDIVGTDTTSGLGFKLPWVHIEDYSIRNQVVSYVGDGNGQTGPAIPAQDKDGATATIDLVVRYSINPASVEDIYRQYQTEDNFVSRLVQNDIRSIVRNIPLKYSTTDFRRSREQAALEMQNALTEKWKNVGLTVDAVDLRDIRYPENIEKSLQAVQEAINNANKAKADLETAKVEAEKTRVDAQAQADADQIIRCGAKVIPVTETINGTATSGLRTIPLQGTECQNRLNEQVLTSKYINMLLEAAKAGNTIYVVPSNSSNILQLPAPKATK